MKVQRTVGEPVVMYHGTSSGMLDHILAHG